MQRIHNDRDRADDGRHVRKNRQGPQDAFSTAGPAAFAGDAITRFASRTTPKLFVFSCAHGASLLDSCAIIFHKRRLDNIPIG
jgi:hypothetical protein